MTPASPSNLDRVREYEVLGTFARGGMAELLLARRAGAELEQLVLIKRILPEYAREPEFARMLIDEARIAATLHHRNVVRVHSVGEDGGLPFLVMELLLGEDLGHVLARAWTLGRRIPVEAAIEIAIAICAGLDHAHERCGSDGTPLEIVHRDVSPQNAFVTYDGVIKLLDFGIARTAATLGHTRTGVAKGKVAYMSPEQAYCREVDRRTDIFSLGILLWEMTTGRRLYARASELETLKALGDRDAPRPSTIVANYPSELEDIVMTCLARDKQHRWPSCRDLAERLEALARRHGMPIERSVDRLMRELFPAEIAGYDRASRSAADLAELALARANGQRSRPWERTSKGVCVTREPSYEHLVVEPVVPASQPERSAPRRWRAGRAAAALAAVALTVGVSVRGCAGSDETAARIAPLETPVIAHPVAPRPVISPIDPIDPVDPHASTKPPVTSHGEPLTQPATIGAVAPKALKPTNARDASQPSQRAKTPQASKPPKPPSSPGAVDAPIALKTPAWNAADASKPATSAKRPPHPRPKPAATVDVPAPPVSEPPASSAVPVNDQIPRIAPPTCPEGSACVSP